MTDLSSTLGTYRTRRSESNAVFQPTLPPSSSFPSTLRVLVSMKCTAFSETRYSIPAGGSSTRVPGSSTSIFAATRSAGCSALGAVLHAAASSDRAIPDAMSAMREGLAMTVPLSARGLPTGGVRTAWAQAIVPSP